TELVQNELATLLDPPTRTMTYALSPLMQFGFAIREGKFGPKRITYAADGNTNSTLLKIGTKGLAFGSTAGRWAPQQAPLGKGSDGRERQGQQSVWIYDNLHVTQVVEIVPSNTGAQDTCLVRYILENKGDRAQEVGLRLLLDTYMVDNDG